MKRLILPVMLGATIALASASTNPEHERLRIRNDLKAPEDVVSYYCARDASGFVWSGLLDSERRAFTLWEEAPQQDSFYVARDYTVSKGTVHGNDAEVTVDYVLLAVADAHGTRSPPPESRRTVNFLLKRVAGAWKIAKPEAAVISPVVLESKFFSGIASR